MFYVRAVKISLSCYSFLSSSQLTTLSLIASKSASQATAINAITNAVLLPHANVLSLKCLSRINEIGIHHSVNEWQPWCYYLANMPYYANFMKLSFLTIPVLIHTILALRE